MLEINRNTTILCMDNCGQNECVRCCFIQVTCFRTTSRNFTYTRIWSMIVIANSMRNCVISCMQPGFTFLFVALCTQVIKSDDPTGIRRTNLITDPSCWNPIGFNDREDLYSSIMFQYHKINSRLKYWDTLFPIIEFCRILLQDPIGFIHLGTSPVYFIFMSTFFNVINTMANSYLRALFLIHQLKMSTFRNRVFE